MSQWVASFSGTRSCGIRRSDLHVNLIIWFVPFILAWEFFDDASPLEEDEPQLKKKERKIPQLSVSSKG